MPHPETGNSTDHAKLEVGKLVWCVFSDGVTAGLYAGTQTFKKEGKPDFVGHYVQLGNNDYSQYVAPQHIYSDILEANREFKKYAQAMVAHLKKVAKI